MRAETEQRARELAAGQAGREEPAAWLDPKLSTCVPLEPDGPEVVVIEDHASS